MEVEVEKEDEEEELELIGFWANGFTTLVGFDEGGGEKGSIVLLDELGIEVGIGEGEIESEGEGLNGSSPDKQAKGSLYLVELKGSIYNNNKINKNKTIKVKKNQIKKKIKMRKWKKEWIYKIRWKN